MKKVLLLMFLLCIYALLNNMIVYSKESINLNLSKNEIAITFVRGNVLVSNNENTLLLLNEADDNIKKFGNIYVLNINNINKSFDFKTEYPIKKEFIIDDVLYKFESNIVKINYFDYTFCIYNKKESNLSNVYGCNFLYLFDISDINTIEVDDNMDIVFFNEVVNLPEYFIENLYSKWIDIYKLSNNEYVVLKLHKDDYKIIVIRE